MSKPTGAATRRQVGLRESPGRGGPRRSAGSSCRLPIRPTYEAGGRCQVIERFLVVAMPAGDDQGVGVGRDLAAREDLLDRPDEIRVAPPGTARRWRTGGGHRRPRRRNPPAPPGRRPPGPRDPAPTITSRTRGQVGRKRHSALGPRSRAARRPARAATPAAPVPGRPASSPRNGPRRRTGTGSPTGRPSTAFGMDDDGLGEALALLEQRW